MFARNYWNPTLALREMELESQRPQQSRYTSMDPFELAGMTNAFMTAQAQAPFLANFPDYMALNQQRSSNIGAGLRGEVPTDVVNQIVQRGAERGVGMGAPRSPNANAAWLQALGLTSLGLQDKASTQFNEAVAATPVPELFNPASLFLPERFAELEREEYNRRNQPVRMPPRYVSYNEFAPQWGTRM